MSLPRVRITLGGCLFAVAFSAVNFAAIRWVYQSDDYRDILAPWPSGTLGLAPLAEIAVLGVFFGAIRAIRSWRGRGTRTSPAAFTFFNLQFLALIGAAFYFIPYVFDSYLRTVSNTTDQFNEPVSHLVWYSRENAGWIVLRGVLVCLIFSGPPLLLSGLGYFLARRTALKLSRPRFRVLTGLVTFGFAGAAFAIAVQPRPFNDSRGVALDFHVVDQETGEPIVGAFITVDSAFRYWDESLTARGLTGPDGRTQLTQQFSASGERNVFRSMGSFEPWGRWLEISAPNHQPLRIPLTDMLGARADLEHPNLATIRLVRGAEPRKEFADIAGEYQEFRSWFRIKPDGRFTWTRSGGCMSPGFREYGRVKRVGDTLIFQAFPQIGEENHPDMRETYRMVTWGDRLFLCSMSEMNPFLRGHLRDSRFSRMFYGYRREADEKKPLIGFPRLPAQLWVNFALGELRLDDEDSSVRRVLKEFVRPFRKEQRDESIAVGLLP